MHFYQENQPYPRSPGRRQPAAHRRGAGEAHCARPQNGESELSADQKRVGPVPGGAHPAADRGVADGPCVRHGGPDCREPGPGPGPDPAVSGRAERCRRRGDRWGDLRIEGMRNQDLPGSTGRCDPAHVNRFRRGNLTRAGLEPAPTPCQLPQRGSHMGAEGGSDKIKKPP